MSKSERLRSERERLGLTQDALSVALGHSRKTQTLYETGKRSPDWEYLDSFGQLGADLLFILTGERSTSPAPLPSADDLPPRLRSRLAAAIEAVEAGIEITGRVLTPSIKAELILAAYDVLAKEGEAATAQIIRLVRA